MADEVGIKVSQAGYDVKDCADYQLLFSSSNPSLIVAMEGSFTVVDNDTDQVIATHNLGYYPFIMVYAQFGGYSTTLDNYYDRSIDIKTDTIVWNIRNGTAVGTIYYYIFALDIEHSYTGTLVSGTKKDDVSINTEFGIKVSLPGKDVNSADLRDFCIHSGTRNLQPHSYGRTAITTGPFPSELSHTETHMLGYPALSYFFVRKQDENSYHHFMTNMSTYYTLTSTYSKFQTLDTLDNTPYYLAHVIFKDPLL